MATTPSTGTTPPPATSKPGTRKSPKATTPPASTTPTTPPVTPPTAGASTPVTPTTPSAVRVTPPVSTTPAKKKNWKLWIFVGILVLLAIYIVCKIISPTNPKVDVIPLQSVPLAESNVIQNPAPPDHTFKVFSKALEEVRLSIKKDHDTFSTSIEERLSESAKLTGKAIGKIEVLEKRLATLETRIKTLEEKRPTTSTETSHLKKLPPGAEGPRDDTVEVVDNKGVCWKGTLLVKNVPSKEYPSQRFLDGESLWETGMYKHTIVKVYLKGRGANNERAFREEKLPLTQGLLRMAEGVVFTVSEDSLDNIIWNKS